MQPSTGHWSRAAFMPQDRLAFIDLMVQTWVLTYCLSSFEEREDDFAHRAPKDVDGYSRTAEATPNNGDTHCEKLCVR